MCIEMMQILSLLMRWKLQYDCTLTQKGPLAVADETRQIAAGFVLQL